MMKTLLIGINAKYIHPNMAIRLLKANSSFPVDLKEWTIKDDSEVIYNYISANNYEIIAISCYIWNIEIIKELLLKLKNTSYPGTIILGGPEVSYENDEFFSLYNVNYIIVGEGEIAFDALLNSLYNKLDPRTIDNLHTKDYKNKMNIIKNLDQLNSGFFDLDYPNQIMYIESSRGCPFNCSYCMASLEKSLRFFDLDKIKKQIKTLIDKGARTFKFLDRTFNASPKRTIDLFDYLISVAPRNASFQFEIVAELLTDELIEYINTKVPKKLFRFEIGVQSTNDKTNILINRIQNKELLFRNIAKLRNANRVDLHLDLIAGLPEENLSSFKTTFNEVINLRPLELQLGFLKLLKGTKLYYEAKKYNYSWDQSAPYEIFQNDCLAPVDIETIHIVEKVNDKYYNSSFMPLTINYLLDNVKSVFDFFLDYGTYYQTHYSWLGYNLHDLFKRLDDYIKTQDTLDSNYLLYLMKQDYLSYYNIKPYIWWARIPKGQYRKKVNSLLESTLSQFKNEDIFRYGIVETYKNKGFLILYKPDEKIMYKW